MKGNGKYYIALHGEVHEVSRDVYQAYYQGKRKEKYIYEQDQVHENHILDISGMEEFHSFHLLWKMQSGDHRRTRRCNSCFERCGFGL